MFARNIRLRHLLAEVVNESLRFNLIQTSIPIKVKRYEDLATQIAHCQVIQLVQLIQLDHLAYVFDAFLHLSICHLLRHFCLQPHSILSDFLFEIALESTLV